MTVKISSILSSIPQTSATMSSRDHPFNRSTRPLLAERKPPLVLKKKSITDNKIVHGFNDFDIISQQFNNMSTHTHIGYPYGSPPSPTVVNSNDFVFSDDGHTGSIYSTPIPARTTFVPPKTGSENNHHHHNNRSHYRTGDIYSKPSKFGDVDWQTSTHQINHRVVRMDNNSSLNASRGSNGPFIFGVHTPNINNVGTNNRTVISATTKYSDVDGLRPVLNQSNSDTSTSSQGNEKDRRLLFKDRKETTKRNRKDKKFNKNKGPNIKCVLVGDGAVGKTNLIVSYLENRFLHEHVPTASDIYNAEVMVNDSPVQITLCDTAGQDTLDPLRELCYPDSDVFLLCFSIVKPETFRSIKTKWAPKFSKTKATLILIGTQADLRNDNMVLNKLQMQGEKPISFTDAWDLATSIGGKYIETSSFTQDKVKDVFDAAIWDTLLPRNLPPTPPLWKKLLCLV